MKSQHRLIETPNFRQSCLQGYCDDFMHQCHPISDLHLEFRSRYYLGA